MKKASKSSLVAGDAAGIVGDNVDNQYVQVFISILLNMH